MDLIEFYSIFIGFHRFSLIFCIGSGVDLGIWIRVDLGWIWGGSGIRLWPDSKLILELRRSSVGVDFLLFSSVFIGFQRFPLISIEFH